MTITPPELSIQSLSVPGTGIAGRSVGIPNTVVNTAGAPGTAPSFQVGLYLASSSFIDPTANVLLASRTVASLAPAATSAATTTVTLPTTPGRLLHRRGRGPWRCGGRSERNQQPDVERDHRRPQHGPPVDHGVGSDHAVGLRHRGQQRLGQAPGGTFVVPTQTAAAWGGTVRLVSGPQINTMTIAGSVTVAGALSGTFTIVNSGGARGNGSFTGTVATPGSPGAVAATFTGSFTVGEICSISGSFTSP